MISYDNRWNANEWFVIGMLIVGAAILTLLPKRFPLRWSAVFTLYGIFAGLFLDHSISVKPVDYYDVNETSKYEFLDFLTYLMYGPFSYLFAYLLDRWSVKPSYAPLYVLGWSILSIGVEWVADRAGVFHYKNGYGLYYSFPIYLLMSSLYLVFLYKAKGMRERGV